MRKITVMGSHLCPDTIYAVNKLVEAGFKVTYKDILSCQRFTGVSDDAGYLSDVRGYTGNRNPGRPLLYTGGRDEDVGFGGGVGGVRYGIRFLEKFYF